LSPQGSRHRLISVSQSGCNGNTNQKNNKQSDELKTTTLKNYTKLTLAKEVFLPQGALTTATPSTAGAIITAFEVWSNADSSDALTTVSTFPSWIIDDVRQKT
jgi:hypothetical protein